MKKNISISICILCMAATSCQIGDFGDDFAAPQRNEQEEAVTRPSSLNVTPASQILLQEHKGDSVQVATLGSVDIPEGSALGNFKLVLDDKYKTGLSGSLKTTAEELQSIVETAFDADTVYREFKARIEADIYCGEQTMYLASKEYTLSIRPFDITADSWTLIGVNGDFNNDIAMTEVAPGIWASGRVSITSGEWKVRCNHVWDVNRGGATPTQAGEFVEAVSDGKNIGLTGDLIIVYNANNETIGSMTWGITGSIASIEGFNWNRDIPMNLGKDGKYYGFPLTLTTTDEIKLRKYAGWDENRGGDCSAADAEFDAVSGGNNIKAPSDGTYMVVYDPASEKITLSKLFWGIIGDFCNWKEDLFMIYDGAGKWAAYNKSFEGTWKLRQGCSWDVNRGGAYVSAGEPFAVTNGGDNITVGDITTFDVIYDSAAETITLQ